MVEIPCMQTRSSSVIPAHAGNQAILELARKRTWIPAFAGMTESRLLVDTFKFPRLGLGMTSQCRRVARKVLMKVGNSALTAESFANMSQAVPATVESNATILDSHTVSDSDLLAGFHF